MQKPATFVYSIGALIYARSETPIKRVGPRYRSNEGQLRIGILSLTLSRPGGESA